MDKKEFRDWLETVAVVKDLAPVKDPNIRSDDAAVDQVRFEDEWVTVTTKENPSLGFKMIKLKEQHRSCELGCGDIVPNQVIEQRFCSTPVAHWRTRCNACGLFVSPDGKSFISGGHAIQIAYNKHFRVEGAEKSKPKPICAVRQPNDQPYTETVTSTGVIRQYK